VNAIVSKIMDRVDKPEELRNIPKEEVKEKVLHVMKYFLQNLRKKHPEIKGKGRQKKTGQENSSAQQVCQVIIVIVNITYIVLTVNPFHKLTLY